eukprot:177557-Chlamydomonas_euryale.AAC.13
MPSRLTEPLLYSRFTYGRQMNGMTVVSGLMTEAFGRPPPGSQGRRDAAWQLSGASTPCMNWLFLCVPLPGQRMCWCSRTTEGPAAVSVK